MNQKSNWISKKLIFVMGKGGVGKTTISHAIAQELAAQGKNTLLCHVLQLSTQPQTIEQIAPSLSEVYLNAMDCFQEYVSMKLKIKALTSFFLNSKITQYLQKASPGIQEMVILGKIWNERTYFDHIVIDMPSTGYALAMLNTPVNFAAIFPGGPIYNDCLEMTETLQNKNETALIVVALPEEMPLQESLELSLELKKLYKANTHPFIFLNRIFLNTPEANTLFQTKWSALSENEKQHPLWQSLYYSYFKEIKQKELLRELDFPRPDLNIPEITSTDETKKITLIQETIKGAIHENP